MALILVGCNETTFPSKDDKNVMIHGVNLHCIEGMSEAKLGYRVQKFFVHDRKPGYQTALSAPLGSIITPIYNRFGKVDDVIWKTPEKKFEFEF